MHFFPTVIAKTKSKYSGEIKVVEGLGFRHLSTNSIQHSGGIVSEIWSTALKPFAQKRKSWLVLGVAGGSVIKLMSRKYQPTVIVGIDIDPVIIDLGYKYFNLSKIPDLEVKIADAAKYIENTNDNYDFILVDLFGRDSCPDFVYQPNFLKKLSALSPNVFINHLYSSPKSKKVFQLLQNRIKNINPNPKTKYILQNVVIKV